MIRFKEFILEESDFDLDKFKDDCEDFLNTIIPIRIPLFHGSKNYPDDWEIREPLRNRSPRDTPLQLHNRVNDYLEDKFGWSARSNGVFVTSSYIDAQSYFRGGVCMIFPIGKWKYMWNYVSRDMTVTYDEFRGGLSDTQPNADLLDIRQTAIDDTFEHIKHGWRYNEGFKDALEKQHEIIIDCDEYYILNRSGSAWNEVHEWLMEKGFK